MIVYEHFCNGYLEAWYDSSNIIYSKCFEHADSVTLNIVFKGGRTYKYRSVEKNDYLMFKVAESTGVAFNEFIKKYECVRIADTNLDELDKYYQSLKDTKEEMREGKVKDIDCKVEINPSTQEFGLYVNDKLMYSGVEGQVSLFALLSVLNVGVRTEETDFALSKLNVEEQ